jgi:hypothetical protein
MSTATAFEAVISAWDQQMHCEMTTQAGARCRRLAYWRADLHGCEQALLCGHHKSSWMRRTMHQFRIDGAARCWRCYKQFDSFDAACKVLPL